MNFFDFRARSATSIPILFADEPAEDFCPAAYSLQNHKEFCMGASLRGIG